LRILEEYRCKCEEDGNYLEAERAFKQLEVLRLQEEKVGPFHSVFYSQTILFWIQLEVLRLQEQ
jgi:hypothetical protein